MKAYGTEFFSMHAQNLSD